MLFIETIRPAFYGYEENIEDQNHAAYKQESESCDKKHQK